MMLLVIGFKNVRSLIPARYPSPSVPYLIEHSTEIVAVLLE